MAAVALVAAVCKAVVVPPKVAARGGEARRAPTKARNPEAGARRRQGSQDTAKHRGARRDFAARSLHNGRMRQSDHPDPRAPRSAGVAAVYTQPNAVEEPTFLGANYVCTELPTHITCARTKEEQALVDQAYEGWSKEV